MVRVATLEDFDQTLRQHLAVAATVATIRQVDLQAYVHRFVVFPDHRRDAGPGGSLDSSGRHASALPGRHDPEQAYAMAKPNVAHLAADAVEQRRVAAVHVRAGAAFVVAAVQVDQQPEAPLDLLMKLQVELALSGFVAELLLHIRSEEHTSELQS